MDEDMKIAEAYIVDMDFLVKHKKEHYDIEGDTVTFATSPYVTFEDIYKDAVPMQPEQCYEESCREDNGCPTEKAVLRREWNRLRTENAQLRRERDAAVEWIKENVGCEECAHWKGIDGGKACYFDGECPCGEGWQWRGQSAGEGETE